MLHSHMVNLCDYEHPHAQQWCVACMMAFLLLHTCIWYVTLDLSRERNIRSKNRKSFFKHLRYNWYLLYACSGLVLKRLLRNIHHLPKWSLGYNCLKQIKQLNPNSQTGPIFRYNNPVQGICTKVKQSIEWILPTTVARSTRCRLETAAAITRIQQQHYTSSSED